MSGRLPHTGDSINRLNLNSVTDQLLELRERR
jgi:hypothetical protein